MSPPPGGHEAATLGVEQDSLKDPTVRGLECQASNRKTVPAGPGQVGPILFAVLVGKSPEAPTAHPSVEFCTQERHKLFGPTPPPLIASWEKSPRVLPLR